MKRSAFIVILVSIFFLIPSLAMADVSVSMRLDRNEATIADSVTVTVAVSGASGGNYVPVLHGVEKFDVSQEGTSSRIEIINGRMSSEVDYTFLLRPRETGTFEIGPAEVTIGGKTYRTNTATLKVVHQARSSGANQGPIFLTARLSSPEVYVEGQVIYTLKLYHQVKVSNVSLELPQEDYLSFRQLGKPLQYHGIYNGRSYQVLEVRYAVIPSRDGIYHIHASKMDMTVFRHRSQSPWDFFNDPFFSSAAGRPMTLASESLDLKVLPLPQRGRPKGFSGLVGDFEISSRLEPARLKAGDSATLTVVLKGRGNVDCMPDLKLPELDHIKVYADEPVLKVSPDEKGLKGSKTMKWALVPERGGHYRIPPLGISFFDPKAHQYRVARTSPISLNVLPGQTGQARLPSAQAVHETMPVKEAVKELGHDILPIHTSIQDLGTGLHIRPGGLAFWAVLMAPLFIYLMTFLGLRLRERSYSSRKASRARGAARELIRKCHRERLSFSDMALSVRTYLNDRFGLSLGSLTPDEAAEILESNGVSHDLAQELHSVFQGIEDAIYTGRAQEACPMREDISRLVQQIEKEIR